MEVFCYLFLRQADEWYQCAKFKFYCIKVQPKTTSKYLSAIEGQLCRVCVIMPMYINVLACASLYMYRPFVHRLAE